MHTQPLSLHLKHFPEITKQFWIELLDKIANENNVS